MTTFLYILVAAGLTSSVVLAYKLHKAHKHHKALADQWKHAYKQVRGQMDAMRSQLTVQSNELQRVRDKLLGYEARDAVVALLDEGDRQRTMTDKVLTSAGFAETMPAEEWRATEPFQPTRLQAIPGIIDGSRKII